VPTLWQDIRYGLRVLRKSPGFTAVAILTLALGIGASTVVFSLFYSLLLAPFAARDASRLAVPSIEKSGQELFPLTHSLTVYEEMREQSRAFEDLVAYTHRFVHVFDGHTMRQFYVGYVTANAFTFYGVRALRGRGLAVADGESSAAPVFVISYKTWQSEFSGDPSVLGKTFVVDDQPRTLVGIMPLRFQAYGATVSAWIPIANHESAFESHPDLFLIGRLRPGLGTDTAAQELEIILGRIAKAHPVDFPEHFKVKVQSATDYFLGPWGIGSAGGSEFGLKQLLYNLMAGVLVLLLIACSNVANLLLARATTREKEIAVRAALGATGGRLVRQLLTESFVLSIAACGLGCLFAWFGVRGAATVVPAKGIGIGGEAAIRLNFTVLIFALGITMLTALISGLAPALHAARGDLQVRLAGGGDRAGTNRLHGKFRSILVVGEVALSIVLLIGAGLMIRSFLVVTHIDLGFNPRDLVVAPIGAPPGRYETPEQNKVFADKILQGLKTLPGVADAAVNNSLPGYNGGFESEVAVSGEDYLGRAKFEGCSEGLLRTLGLRLKRGRWLSESEVDSAQHVAVVNESLARQFFGAGDPVGKQIRLKAFAERTPAPRDPYLRIIGVVADIKNNGGPELPAMPGAFIPYTIEGGTIILIRTTVPPASLQHAIQQRVWSVDPDVLFVDFEPLGDTLQRLTYSAPTFGLTILGSLAGMALVLVIVGTFSVIAYTVSLRRREIGVRMALGAQQGQILWMVLNKGLALIVAGMLIGMFASSGLTRFLASQIWGVSPMDPWTFAVVGAVVIFTGLAATLLPARRATRIDPMVALRYE
jgi:putative ABC transport system permease protein